MSKNKYAVSGASGEYARSYPAFCGVDFTSDPASVDVTRFAYIKNMWRDWESEQGGAIETVPGYRKIYDGSDAGRVNGIHQHPAADVEAVLHIGNGIFPIGAGGEPYRPIYGLADHRSAAFSHQNSLYMLDGTDYYRLCRENDSKWSLKRVSDEGYVPISYSDGLPYEQRNMLSDKFINRYNLVNHREYLDEDRWLAYEYDHDKLTATVTGFGKDVNWVWDYIYFPKSVEHEGTTYSVTAIADGVFASNNTIKSVYIPYYIKSIGKGAFANCRNLETLSFASGPGKYTALEVIGEDAFSGCPKLSYIVIPSVNPNAEGGHTTTVGLRAFCGCGVSRGIFAVGLGGGVIFQNMDGTDEEKDENLPFLTEGVYLELFPSPAISSEDPMINRLFSKLDIIVEGGGGTNNGGRGRLNEGVERISAGWDMSGTLTPYKIESGESLSALYIFGAATFEASEDSEGYCVIPSGPCFVVIREDSTGNIKYVVSVYVSGSLAEKEKYRYTFTVYDKALSIDDVRINGASIQNQSAYAISTQTSEGYVTGVSIEVVDYSLLPNTVLTLHGTAESSKFTTVDGHVDAMAGNSSYSGTARDAIARCTICTLFDGRIFLSGNPELPNTVFYSHRDLTGANNPAYFGTLNYFNDGVGSQPVTAMMATAYALCVLKKEAEAESAVYYHTGADGGSDILPRVYPSASGSAGIGCVGCACNFSDDPVFLSKRGLEAIGREQVNLERAIEHRSYNVDVKLCAEDLSNARMAEWLGYLVIMCGGHFYLADSRQLFTHKTGVINYEWYYLEDIGSYAGQTQRYYTLTEDMMLNVNGETVSLTQLSVYHGGVYHPLMLSSEREYIEPGSQIRVFPYHNGSMLDTEVFCTVTADGKYIAVDTEGEMVGGTYNAPCELCVINDVLYFGTEDGKVFCFNTDMRGRSVDVGGEEVPVDADRIHRSFYTFDGRRIVSCCVTKSDNCDLPHVTKKTRRGSFVVRAKPFAASKIKARGKIDRGELSEWRELNTSGSSEMDFSDIAFDSFSFAGSSAHLCIVRESFRRWYEKQMCFYSDEYRSPFGIYSAVFCYCVQGRIRI